MASSADIALIIKATDQASPVLRSISAAMGALGSAASLPGKAVGGLMEGLGKLGLAGMGFQALTAGAKGLGDALGVGLNSEMEQVRASINAFTKDGAQTEDILQKIRTEANTTPFAFREMATATAALMPVAKSAKVGLMDLVKQAEILAASNPMEGLEGASFSLREAMTGDFTSIIERFNLSRQTINKLKAEGVPAMEIVRRAMLEMGFDSDLIANKAQTLEGRWSTFLDTIDTLKMKISEPIFDALKEGLTGAQQLFDDNSAAITAFAQGIADNIQRAITIVKALWQAFTFDSGAIGIVMQQLREMFGDEFANAIEPFVQFFMEQIPNIKQTAADAMKAVGQAVGGLADLFKNLAKSGADALGALVDEIALLLGLDPGEFVGGWDTAIGVFNRLRDIGTAAIQGVLDLFSELLGLDPGEFSNGWDQALGIAARAMDLLKEAAANAGAAVSNATGFFRDNTVAGAALAGILAAAATAYGLATASAVAHAIATKAQAAATAIATAAQAALNVVLTANPIGIVVVALAGLAAALIYAYQHSETFRAIVDGAFKAVRQSAADMANGVANAIDGIAAAFEGLQSMMAGIGINVGEGLAAGMRQSAGSVRAAARELANAATVEAQQSFREESPSKTFAEIGKYVAEGLAIGIKDGTFSAVNSMRGLVDKLTEVVRNAGFGDELIAKMENALVGMDAAIGTAEKVADRVTKLRREMSDRELWNKPEALAFQARSNELEKEQLALEKQMMPLVRFREQMARELRTAEEALADVRESGNKRAIKDAELMVAQAKSNLHAAETALEPYEEQNRLLQEREADLRLEQRQWEATQKTAALAQEAVITEEEKLKRLFESQAEAAEDQLRHLNDVTDEFKAQDRVVNHLDGTVNDLNDSIQDLDFDAILRKFNVNLSLDGARAGGGPVGMGHRYLVGERGPEVFVPNANGMIIPNGMGGGNITVVVNVGGSVTTEHDLVESIRRGLIQTARRNGYSALGGFA